MDRLEGMAMLLKVIELGSLSAASRALQVPLTTLSRKISDLEAQLGARLLIRTTRKLTLTDAGAGYVAAARRILEQVDEAEREAAGEFTEPRGELVMTAPLMFGRLHVLPLAAEFLATFPEIHIRMVLTDRNADLIADHVDMAVRIGALPDSSMVATQVGTMRTVTCASPALLARHAMARRPDDLSSLPCVTIDTPMPSPSWRFADPASGAAMDIAIRPRLTVSNPEAAADAAIRQVGIARLLHYQAIDAVRRGDLQIILEAYEPRPVPVHLLHASRGQMPLKMRRFLDFAVPRLKQVLSDVGSSEAGARRS